MNLERLKYLVDQLQVEIVGFTEAKAKADQPVVVPTITFPYLYNSHLFIDQAELNRYMAAVAERDANLDRWEAEESNNYKGSIDSATLTLYDWAFFFNNNLGTKSYAIFSKKPVLKDNATGRLFTPGDVASGFSQIDTSTYATNGGVLARFL